MNVAFYSPNFYPRIGGLETVVLHLATACQQRGHDVTVITQTPASAPDTFPFRVLRRAGFWATVRCLNQADIVVQFNVSLRGLLPWLLTRRPLVLTHHGDYSTGRPTDWLKRLACRLAVVNTGCSQYICQRIPSAVWLPNPFNDTCFCRLPDASRLRELVFVGRLVSEKGVHVLLQALARLKQQGVTPLLTVIGDGPERSALQAQARQLDVSAQVAFVGAQAETDVALWLNEHRIAVIPSVYQEPFGIVALEAGACGCYVIGSQAGGLPEAIGPGGQTVPMNDPDALAGAIADALRQAPPWPEADVAAHLALHTRDAVTTRFLTILAPYARSDRRSRAAGERPLV